MEKTREQLILKFIQVFSREFISTAMFIFWGCACVGETNEGRQIVIALMFGVIYGLCLQIFGFDAACHMNPAVTLCYFILGSVSFVFFFVCLFAQLLGSLIGYAILEAIGTEEFNAHGHAKISNFCVPMVRENLNSAKAIFWEAATTGTLCLLVCSAVDPRNRGKLEGIPIKFTLTIFCVIYVGMPYTGGSMNPVRSFIPALWNNYHYNLWVYCVGPFIGSLFVSVLYHIFFLVKDDELRERMDPVGVASPIPVDHRSEDDIPPIV